MRGATDLPLWAKPNAGMPQLVGGKTIFTQTPEETAAHFGELVEAGARIIGGCCGTTPEHIRALVGAENERDAMIG
jgi:5-methyltetrahydrofolate--homocysteine methyltransferase